jgi:hypothetical protein
MDGALHLLDIDARIADGWGYRHRASSFQGAILRTVVRPSMVVATPGVEREH